MNNLTTSNMEKSFLELHPGFTKTLGFWSEEYKSVIIHSIENRYKTEIIREWCISDIVINRDKVLVKWNKRTYPLSDQQLKEKYGRGIEKQK